MIMSHFGKFTIRFFSYATMTFAGLGGMSVHLGFAVPVVLGIPGMWITGYYEIKRLSNEA